MDCIKSIAGYGTWNNQVLIKNVANLNYLIGFGV